MFRSFEWEYNEIFGVVCRTSRGSCSTVAARKWHYGSACLWGIHHRVSISCVLEYNWITGILQKLQSSKVEVTAMDERWGRVQNLFEELKEKHGSAYSGPQYRLWAEAVASGSHTNTKEPLLGSMFRRQTTCKDRHQSHCSLLNLVQFGCGSSLTPKSVASLRSSYIKQIKELHKLLDLDSISEEDLKRQKEKILAMMDSL